MNKLFLLAFPTALLVFVLTLSFSKTPEPSWTGFYTIGSASDPSFAAPFLTLPECQAWALHILRTDKRATQDDSFMCTEGCGKKPDGGYMCDGNMMRFEGRFTKDSVQPDFIKISNGSAF